MFNIYFPLQNRSKKLELSVPVGMVKYICHSRKYNEFYVYLFLKKYTLGRFECSKQAKEFILSKIDYKKWDSVQKHLDTLVAMKWVGYDKVNNVYFIRGYKKVCDQLNLKSKHHILLPDTSVHDRKEFRLWCHAGIIAHKIKGLQWKKKQGPTKGGPLHTLDSKEAHKLEYAGLSVRQIAKLLNVSIAAVVSIKKKAIRYGYMKSRHRYTKLSDNTNDLPYIREGLNEVWERIKVFKNAVWIQFYDEMHFSIFFKTHTKK